MSLIVKVTDAEFPKLVQDALVKMCGCQGVAVDPLTGQVSVGPMSCSCYCDHRAGCNLLADLVKDVRAIPIYRSADSSGYLMGEVWWFPKDEDFGDDDVCGGTKILASIMLAHELVHARLDSSDEDKAVRGENQIRMERCLPMRMEYVNGTVADFRVGVLDASNRPEYGCTCSICRGGLWKTVDRWLCILHSMYCLPSSISALWMRKPARQPGVPRSSFHTDGSTPIDIRVQQAHTIRERIPLAGEVDQSEPLLPDADLDLTLEHVGFQGAYRALLLAVKGDTVKMLTNFILKPGGHPYLDDPGATLVLFEAVSQSLADGIKSRLTRIQFSDGNGGPSDASDGSVHFLKLRHGDRRQRLALYFYHYPATANQWTRPGGIDGPRWDVIDTVYEIWRDIVRDPLLRQV
jgi:hypothetical protein